MAIENYLDPLYEGASRSIALSDGTGTAIIPDVVISEDHADEVAVTKHPVDTGAPVSDHAYKLPAEVTCTFAWSASASLVNTLLQESSLRGYKSTGEVYRQFREWMDARKLLSLSTGKRSYPSVLITGLKTTTTADSENLLVLEITFEEVTLVSVSTTTLDEAVQMNAKKTASPTSAGTRQGASTGWDKAAAGMA